MRADEYLEHIRALPLGEIDDVIGKGTVTVLAPHPDDESLGCGGLIAAACDRDQAVHVVLMTDGSGSHLNSNDYPRDRLVALRQSEFREAAAQLGVARDRLAYLDLIDGQTRQFGPVFESLVERLVEHVDRTGTQTLCVTWGRDPHCDHETAASAARALARRRPAVKVFFFPIWAWHLEADDVVTEPLPTGYKIDVRPWLDRKRAAVEAHVSQMTDLISDDHNGFRFTAEQLAPLLTDFEYFIALSPS